MNWEAITAVAEILGVIAVLITLVYLSRQINQNTEQERLKAVQAVNTSNGSAFDPIYIPENSIIFTKGQQPYSSLTEHEKIIFDMLMTRLISSFASTTYQYNHDVYDENLYKGVAAYF